MTDPIPQNPNAFIFLADFDSNELNATVKAPHNKNTERSIRDAKSLFEQAHPVLFAELEKNASILLKQLGSIDVAGDLIIGGVMSYKFLSTLANEHGINLPIESENADESYPSSEAEIEIVKGTKGELGESLFSQYTMVPEFRLNYPAYYEVALNQTARMVGRRPFVVKVVIESMLPNEHSEKPNFNFSSNGDRFLVKIDGTSHEILLAEIDHVVGFLIGYELVTRRLLQAEDKIKFESEFGSSS